MDSLPADPVTLDITSTLSAHAAGMLHASLLSWPGSAAGEKVAGALSDRSIAFDESKKECRPTEQQAGALGDRRIVC